jgi:UDP-N-acetylmuramoylalanine--D-glutamate ligase
MFALAGKTVLVIGLGLSGRAACRLLRSRGAFVTAIDGADNEVLRCETASLTAAGVRVQLGARSSPEGAFDLAVVSPGVPPSSGLVSEIVQRGVPLISELELGYQQSSCLNISITGTNGKTTTTEMVASLLTHAQRKTVAAGNIGRPLCEIADQTKELDFVTLEVSSFQLETIQFFRPIVAVLLNLTPDHLDRYPRMADYIRAKARIFENQQPFDWAVVQSEALAQLRSFGLKIPSKVVTFSANSRQADLYLDRGLIISRMPGWAGPLLDMDHCQTRSPHNAENLMAALAVGRIVGIPLDVMQETLKAFQTGPHRCELVAEINGVQFINDSKATNLDAVEKALLSVRAPNSGEPNVWLIAGGKDKGLEFYELGPLLAKRVKHAYLLGQTRGKLRAAWGLFTSCTPVDSLLEAVSEAARNAIPGDVVLLSPACSSFDMFRDYQHRGEVFQEAVERLARPTNSGGATASPIASGGESEGPE